MISIKRNGTCVEHYQPTYNGQSIVIAIDSSKSNTAMIVGNTRGRILDDYEISGAGNDTDVYELCQFTRNELKQLFLGARIQFVGIENIITKKEGEYKGVEIHQSRYKITAVFDNFIFTFQEFFGVMPHLIDNWSWKSSVLPEEYRKRTHKKGSKDYFKDIGSDYGSRKDDVTDAVCIYAYIMKTNVFKDISQVRSTCPTTKNYTWIIFPENVEIPNAKLFEVANDDTLQHNITAVAEAIKEKEMGLFKWPIDGLDLDTIYSDKLQIVGKYKFSRIDKFVTICVGVK